MADERREEILKKGMSFTHHNAYTIPGNVSYT